VQERLRYAPLGWTKLFEFNEADQRVALDTLDYWIDSQAQGRSNLAPEKIPWIAIRTLLAQTVYGGKIDNDFDQRLLNSFLEQLFTEKSFDPEFKLVHHSRSDQQSLVIPDGTSKAQFAKWVDNLPATESPLWLGLPENAETLLLSKKGQSMLRKLLKLQTMVEDDTASSSGQTATATEDKRPAWTRTLRASIDNWKKALPQSLVLMERTAESVKNPLFRFFERETEIGAKLLKKVHTDMNELLQVCDGTIKQTNYTRSLITDLSKGTIPKDWKKYPIPSTTSINLWIVDFSQRLKQLAEIKKSKDFLRSGIWIGGLFSPEAYLTATRQAAAQAKQWSLENLELTVDIFTQGASIDTDDTSFIATGMTLEGATWDFQSKALILSNDTSVALPLVRLTWKHRGHNNGANQHQVTLPVYLSDTRAEFLFAADFAAPASATPIVIYQRGVVLTVWKPNL
jgi:dynein heavy chain 1